MYIGNHLSSSKGFLAMGKEATKLGANTFAFFTRNPRGGSAKPIDPEDAAALMEYMKEHQFGKLVAHAPYTMNVCAAKPDIKKFAREMFKDDMTRMEYVPGQYYNFHPGSHVGQGAEAAIPMIADAINYAVSPNQTTMVLLETMAGKGTEMGRTFEELRAIIDLVECKEKVGVCFDTCHTWDAGYNHVEDFDKVLDEFDKVIGLDLLYAIHLNDSMNDCASHKDRHAKIGEGKIGAEALKYIVKHPKLAGKPFILETPNDDAGYAREIEMIKNW